MHQESDSQDDMCEWLRKMGQTREGADNGAPQESVPKVGAAGLQVDLLRKMLLSMGCTGGYGEDGDSSGDEMDDLGRNVSIQEPDGMEKNIDSLETKDKDAFVSTMNKLLRMYDEGASRLSMCEFLHFWGPYPYNRGADLPSKGDSDVSQTSELEGETSYPQQTPLHPPLHPPLG